MKLILRITLIALLTYLLSFYLPWWIVVASAFVVGFLLHGHGFSVFISGFLGAGLVWMVYAWYLDYLTGSVLSDKVVALFPVEDHLFLIVGSGLIGALCGGFGAVAGSSFRSLFHRKKSTSFYNS